jgi:hypothetical protein
MEGRKLGAHDRRMGTGIKKNKNVHFLNSLVFEYSYYKQCLSHSQMPCFVSIVTTPPIRRSARLALLEEGPSSPARPLSPDLPLDLTTPAPSTHKAVHHAYNPPILMKNLESCSPKCCRKAYHQSLKKVLEGVNLQ